MRNRSNDKKSPADPGAAHVEVAFYPYRDDTATAVTLVRGLGARAVRLRVWSGHLPCRRGELVGMDASQVTILLCGQLWDLLSTSKLYPVAQSAQTSREAGSAPLEGPQGDLWTQPTLDFLTAI